MCVCVVREAMMQKSLDRKLRGSDEKEVSEIPDVIILISRMEETIKIFN